MKLIPAVMACSVALFPPVAVAQSLSTNPAANTASRAMQAQADCLIGAVRSLDDYKSDAGTIADGAMGICTSQINAVEREASSGAPFGTDISKNDAVLDTSVRRVTIALVLKIRREREAKR
jgi:hypothetical protein